MLRCCYLASLSFFNAGAALRRRGAPSFFARLALDGRDWGGAADYCYGFGFLVGGFDEGGCGDCECGADVVGAHAGEVVVVLEALVY